MAPTQEQITLVRKYEPILYFHHDERFFPVDPKRYLEECALWRTRIPSATKDEWGEEAPGVFPKKPMIPRAGVAAINTPDELQGHVWLGDLLPVGMLEDRFLALGGWEDSTSVALDTENRHSSLTDIQQVFQPNGNPDLSNSRFWYYAEILDAVGLAALIKETPAISAHNIDLGAILRLLTNPRLITYHLFYPAHEEPLEGCEDWGQGKEFGSFAGEWGCVAVLEQDGKPTHIGVTQRNVGKLAALDDESRIGMAVQPWHTVLTAAGHPNTAKVYVSRGTHGNYLAPGTGVHELAPFSSERFDISRDSCGKVEQLDDVVTPGEEFTPPFHGPSPLVVIAKLVLPIIGWAWLGVEEIHPFAEGSPLPTPHPVDMTPAGGQFGMVIHPEGVAVTEPVTGKVVWKTSQTAAPGGEIGPIDGRRYGFIVDRSTQIWWPTRETHGYDGRWGPNVTHDPKFRRSGMRTPQFWRMFFVALAKTG